MPKIENLGVDFYEDWSKNELKKEPVVEKIDPIPEPIKKKQVDKENNLNNKSELDIEREELINKINQLGIEEKVKSSVETKKSYWKLFRDDRIVNN